MQRFFVEPSQIDGDEIIIRGGDVKHIKQVLRLKPGDQVEVSDGQGIVYLAELVFFGGSPDVPSHFTSEQVLLTILERRKIASELPSKVILYQALPKSDKMELIIQKMVELGVYEIVPVVTSRCVVKLDDAKASKKVKRWNDIAQAAAKQSGRGIIPNVAMPLAFTEALRQASACDVKLIPYEMAEDMSATKTMIEQIKPGQSIAIFIGPEGGFALDEVQAAIALGCTPITLGKRILRTETAGLCVMSVLMFQLEE